MNDLVTVKLKENNFKTDTLVFMFNIFFFYYAVILQSVEKITCLFGFVMLIAVLMLM